MDEDTARKILGPAINDKINSLFTGKGVEGGMISWHPPEERIWLDGKYDPDTLEAIAWWMRNKK